MRINNCCLKKVSAHFRVIFFSMGGYMQYRVLLGKPPTDHSATVQPYSDIDVCTGQIDPEMSGCDHCQYSSHRMSDGKTGSCPFTYYDFERRDQVPFFEDKPIEVYAFDAPTRQEWRIYHDRLFLLGSYDRPFFREYIAPPDPADPLGGLSRLLNVPYIYRRFQEFKQTVTHETIVRLGVRELRNWTAPSPEAMAYMRAGFAEAVRLGELDRSQQEPPLPENYEVDFFVQHQHDLYQACAKNVVRW